MAYVPHTDAERRAMLERLGLADLEPLFADIPEVARLRGPLDVPGPMAEVEVDRFFYTYAAKNANVDDWPCFLGGGFYDRHVPAAVEALVGRGEFLTAYTPYQPELSQGTLAAMYEFQSFMATLTGLAVAQASVYDGASALGEAALLAMNATGGTTVVFDRRVLPEYRQVVATYIAPRGGRLVVAEPDEPAEAALTRTSERVAAVVVQQPDVFGAVRDYRGTASAAHAREALAVAVADPVALAVVEPPGAMGFDVVVGEGQPLGNPLNYGGPTFGFFAVTEALVRRLPGRLSGATRDVEGRRGFVLTLQAREQHIRREKATSNICSNHQANALAATVYLSLLGPEGLREVARTSAALAHYLVERLAPLGVEPAIADPWLYEVALRVPGPAAALNAHLLQQRILGGADMGRWDPAWEGLWQIGVTERRTRAELDRLVTEVARWISR